MFHSENGLYFQRQENGDVLIIKKHTAQADEEQIDFQQIVPNDIWCSIVASVSRAGEENRRWYLAKEFHNKE
jgi:hypothetical protein